MATGGTARYSVKGSDEYYPFMCSPCSRKKIDVGAEVYCEQCKEYLCGKCHTDHNKFAMMAAHTMLDRAQMESKGPQTVQPLLTVPCDRHPGQTYTLFCEKHDQVCCAVCSQINHKSCKVRYILDVAHGAIQGQELKQFRRAMEEIRKNLEKAKKQREMDIQRISDEKTSAICKIHASIQRMIKQLEAIEKTAADDVTRKFTEFKIKIENDFTKLDKMINTVNTKLDKLEKANDDAEKFVRMKICKEDKSSAMNLIEDVEARAGGETLGFMIDARVEEYFYKLKSLVEIVRDYRYAVTPVGQHCVKTKKDERVCSIIDMCLTEDGSLLMTDINNKCLKRVNKSYKVIDRLKFDDEPWVVCCVSASQAAVTLSVSKTVQLVQLNPTMSKSSSFKITGVGGGISYHAGHLYVACGGHIAVYTISGTLVRKLGLDSPGQKFKPLPQCVTVRRSDDVILVCDRVNGLVALGPSGQRLWTVTCEDMKVERVTNVTVDSHGQALVLSYGDNKVVLVSKDGRLLGSVLTDRDGINNPYCLCFDGQQSQLAVGMQGNDQISIFKLA